MVVLSLVLVLFINAVVNDDRDGGDDDDAISVLVLIFIISEVVKQENCLLPLTKFGTPLPPIQ